jgi:hypothetical protein
MGRAYGARPSELLEIDGGFEALLVDARCWMQGKREGAERLRTAARNKQMIFINQPVHEA